MMDIDKETVVRNVRHFDDDVIEEFEESELESINISDAPVPNEESEEQIDALEPDDLEDDDWSDTDSIDSGL